MNRLICWFVGHDYPPRWKWVNCFHRRIYRKCRRCGHRTTKLSKTYEDDDE